MSRGSLKITIDSARAFYLAQGIKSKAINDAFRSAGEAVGDYWQLKFLPKHLKPGAMGRYSYKPRTWRWNRFKVERKRYFERWGPQKGWCQIAKPQPQPWILAGRQRNLLEHLLGYGNLTVKATASGAKGGGQKLKVTVAVPLIHPINPLIASKYLGPGRGELVRIIRSESKEMAHLLMSEVQRLLGRIDGVRQVIRITA